MFLFLFFPATPSLPFQRRNHSQLEREVQEGGTYRRREGEDIQTQTEAVYLRGLALLNNYPSRSNGLNSP